MVLILFNHRHIYVILQTLFFFVPFFHQTSMNIKEESNRLFEIVMKVFKQAERNLKESFNH